MATTQQKREWWADWRCNPLQMVAVSFPGTDRDWHLPVADAAVPAFELFAALMRKHDYDFREVSGGTYNCRKIGGTTSWSLHAYGIAIDLNPSRNPYGTTTHDFPQDFIEEVLATGLFRWGMTFRDPMHWEIDVPPSAIGDDMPLSDDDLKKIRQIVWFNADMDDYTSGQLLHASTLLRHARNDAFQARVDAAVARRLMEQGALSSTPLTQTQIEAIAEEVADELRARLAE